MSRRKTELTFKGAVKGRLGLVADLCGDMRDAAVRRREHLGAEPKPPACEIGIGVSENTPEPFGEYGPRSADVVASAAIVKDRQAYDEAEPRLSIGADTGQPASLFLWEPCDVSSQRFNE